MQSAEETIERYQRGVGVLSLRQFVEQDRNELGEMGACEGAPERAIFTAKPARNGTGGFRWLPETERRKPIDGRTHVVRVNRERCPRTRRRQRGFEQTGIMTLHVVQMREQDLRESFAASEAHELSEAFKRLLVGRQGMGLLVCHHLQPVLDGAQKPIGGIELVTRTGLDPAVLRERLQCRQGLARAQRRIAAAGDQLLGLHEELDLANAAASELDVVSLYRDLAVAAVDVDLLLHGVHVGERRIVEILAPDEWLEFGQQRLARGAVARADAGLDHGRPLPILTATLVVVAREGGRHRDLGRGRIRPQTQVEAKHIAVGGTVLQELDQCTGHPHEQHPRLNPFRRSGDIRVEQDDEVDIARVVELVRSHLSEREHGVAGPALGLRRVGNDQLAFARCLRQQVTHRRADRRIGDLRQRLHDGGEVPYAAGIRSGNEERRLCLGPAPQAHRGRLIVRRGLSDVHQEGVEPRLRIGLEQGDPARRHRANQIEQIGRAIGNGCGEITGARLNFEQCRKRRASGTAGNRTQKMHRRAPGPRMMRPGQ